MKQLAISIFVSLLIIASPPIFGQNYYKLFYGDKISDEIPIKLIRQVHSLDDFFGRYNGLHDAYGKPLNQSSELFKEINESQSSWSTFRFKVISSLLHPDLFEEDSLAVLKFLGFASNGKNLSFYSDYWFVEIPFSGILNKSNFSGYLTLQIKYDSKKRTKWIIQDVCFEQSFELGDIKRLIPNENIHYYIPPSAHDNGFIALLDLLNGSKPIKYHISGYSKQLSIFNHLITNENYRPQFSDYRFIFNPPGNIQFELNNQYQIIKIAIQ